MPFDAPPPGEDLLGLADAAAEAGDVVVLEPGGRRRCHDPEALEDLDGTLTTLLRRRGGAVLARPDRLLA